MHLAVVCPACQNQYQVDPNLRGKRMRCPNPICRTVFEVADETNLEASSVTEAVAAAPSVANEQAAAVTPKWSAPPPVRTSAPTIDPIRQPPDEFDFPGDIPGDEPNAEAPAV